MGTPGFRASIESATVCAARSWSRPRSLQKAALSAMAVTALGACQPIQQLCENSDPNWTTRPEIADMAVDVLVVKKTREVFWSGKKVQPQELNALLYLRSEMSPAPKLLLRHEQGADCSQVNDIRTLMQNTLDCASGKCAEGAEWDSIPDRGLPGLG